MTNNKRNGSTMKMICETGNDGESYFVDDSVDALCQRTLCCYLYAAVALHLQSIIHLLEWVHTRPGCSAHTGFVLRRQREESLCVLLRMADDDDDEAFGGFASADTSQPEFQFKRGATADNDDDDEWGDFVKSPQLSQPADLSFTGNPVSSPPAWVKPSGALPLSIFGDADEEEEENEKVEVEKYNHGVSLDFSPTLAPKDTSKPRDLGIIDIYNGYPEIKPDSGSDPNSSGGADPIENGSYSNSIGNAGGSAVPELNNAGFDALAESSGYNKFSLKPNVPLDANSNSDLFWMQGFTGFGSGLNSAIPSVQESGSRLDANGQGQLLGSTATAVNDDDGDDGWEFKDAFSNFGTEEHNKDCSFDFHPDKTYLKVEPVAHEVSERSSYSSASLRNSNKPLDLFGTSNGSLNLFETSTESSGVVATSCGISSTFQEVGFVGIQPNELTSVANSFFDENNNKATLNHSKDDGSEEFDEDFGDFAAAPAENGPKPGVEPVAHEVSERSSYSSGLGRSSNKPLDLFGTSNGSLNLFATSTESSGVVATSSGISSTFQAVGLVGIQPNELTSVTNSFFNENNSKATLNFIKDDGSEEFDEDFGDFTSAPAENGLKPGEISTNGVLYPNGAVSAPNSKEQVDLVAHEVSERSTYSSWNGSTPNKSLEAFEGSNGSFNFVTSSTPSANSATSNAIQSTIQKVDFFGVQSSVATGDGFPLETNLIIEQDNSRGLLKHNSDVGDAEFDEDFGEFTAASAETELEPEEKDTKVDYLTQALPLTFGNEQPEADLFKRQSTSDQRNSQIPTATISVNDWISSLYSQPEHTSSINTFQEPAKTQLCISNAFSSSTVVNHDDHLDERSWSHKDALEKRVDIGGEDTSSELKLNSYLDFYIKLKEELLFVAKSHFGRVKEAQNDAALSGEDSTVSSLDSEFQLVWKELDQMNIYGETNQQDHHPGDNMKGFVQVLVEPRFQIIESEYHLSEKLLLVQKDLRSVVELIRHTITMLKILTIGNIEEQLAYISLWSKMISACLQELKHGALIWSQAKEKHVQRQLLTEPEGREFFWAIGEIYRVVVVLGASAKLFKPWTLLSSADLQGIYILLDESYAVWATSGLEEVISTMSAPRLDDTSLLESIKHILNLDEFELQKYVFAENESRCWLSILTEKVAPGMKMVTWENDECFVTLANLWANLISRNPPKLPRKCFG
ncbi:nucleolar GTPase [Striga asiatica]|uniref:Nucleolar GTPase n=1 Tax=Striga asiatica TaxID=4170 RepID=A0A5A7PJW3_STRAF|nr:nucleolar GTPase [Striga asiatica]